VSETRSGRDLRRYVAPGLTLLAFLVLLVLPLYVEAFWLQTGLFVFAAGVGAIGLNILTGTTGQLSLAHAFFLAVGAYGYAALTGGTQEIGGGIEAKGLTLPPLLAAVLAVLMAGLAGLLFSPIASRLRGIYLGVASLALVFIGQHVLQNAKSVTGGFYGRTSGSFSLFGFSFTDSNPSLTVLGVTFGQDERLWYLGLIVLALSYLFATNLLRGRPGLALQTIRDSEIAAATMGVNVQMYKAAAFVVSSMYAGLAGVLIALAFEQTEPAYFSLALSITYLAMIVIGGLGSVRGAVIGAAFVTALPLVLNHYTDRLSFLAQTGESGVNAGQFANYVYGGLVVLVVLVAPGGIAGLFRSGAGRAARARASAGASAPTSNQTQPQDPTGSASSATHN
jgi:branched-chain amino acid transport system permease protein